MPDPDIQPDPPLRTLKDAYDDWIAGAETSPRRQSVTEELMGEHYVMHAVLTAMEEEARRLKGGAALRVEFWSRVVDFNGNFVHLCHRPKEEQHYIPALVEEELLNRFQIDTVRAEHDRARDLTLGIRDGVEEGDWEKVLQLVMLYTHLLGLHMKHEEDDLFRVAEARLSPAANDRVRVAFDEVDARGLGDRGRREYVGIARELCEATGVDYDW